MRGSITDYGLRITSRGESPTRQKVFVLILFVASVISCSNSDTPDEHLISTYADVIIARESSTDWNDVRIRTDSVLKMHAYDRQDFEEDLRDMGRKPKTFKAFYDSVSQRIARMRDTTSS